MLTLDQKLTQFSILKVFYLQEKSKICWKQETAFKNIFQKYFYMKKYKKHFSSKNVIKYGNFSNFWRVFGHLFSDLKIPDSKEHSRQIAAQIQMNNMERFYRGGWGWGSLPLHVFNAE